jgi:hypothetical protein
MQDSSGAPESIQKGRKYLPWMLAAIALFVVLIALVVTEPWQSTNSHPPALLGAPTPTTGITQDASLVPAEHQQCASLGTLVEKYLETGNTAGYPQLDQTYASERASILAEPQASQLGLARSDADTAIQQCDQNLDNQAAAAANAAQQRQAQANAAAAAQAQAQAQQQAQDAQNAAYRSTCKQHGGTITGTAPDQSGYNGENTDPAGEYCSVTYRGDTYQLPMNSDGTWDSSSAASNKSDCDSDTQNAQSAAQDGVPWTQLPAWHAETGVCEPGSP